jgi:hypothetical protein
MWADEQGRETLLKAANWDAEYEEMQRLVLVASQDRVIVDEIPEGAWLA